jgi:hypothetical protein
MKDNSDAASVNACAHLFKLRSDLTVSTNQFNQPLRIILHGVSIVGIDGTMVSFNLPNKFPKVLIEHNLKPSRASRGFFHVRLFWKSLLL